jgi:hypothetical protein
VTPSGRAAAVVLVRARREREEIARFLDSIEGVRRVERVQGPYDLVVHAVGPDQVEVIEGLPGVTAAEVCWLSSRPEGGAT